MSNTMTRCRQFLEIHKVLFKQSWPVWLVSLVTFLNGFGSIANILLTRMPVRVQYFLPFGVFHWTRSLTLVLGFILVYLSLHLFQRRRAAWWVAVFAAGIRGYSPFNPSAYVVYRITPGYYLGIAISFPQPLYSAQRIPKYQAGICTAAWQSAHRFAVRYIRLLDAGE